MNRPSSRALLGLLLTWSVTLACGKASERLEVAYTTIGGVACLEGKAACGSECVRLDSSAEHCGSCGNVCDSGEVCDLGRCKPSLQGCSSPRLLCGSDCVDPLSDREHCGGCG